MRDDAGSPERARVWEIVDGFPDAIADPVAGLHLSLEVRGKRFGWFMENHHGDERIVINCKALPGAAEALVASNPAVYHIPKFAKNRGWGLGIWLDVPGVDWDEVKELLLDSYVMTEKKAPKRKSPA